MTKTCSTCKFWRRERVDGLCMRYPPTAFLIGMVQGPLGQQQPGFTSAFPTVREELTCGEHQTKLEGLQ
jgi:hypothetical protein